MTTRLLDWLNINSHRAYPIKEDTVMAIPTNFLVDFKLVAKQQEVHAVTLDRVEASGDLVFMADSTEIIVSRPVIDPNGYTRYTLDTDEFNITIIFGSYDIGSIGYKLLEMPIEDSCFTSQYKHRVDTLTGDDILYGVQLYDAGIIPTTPAAEPIRGDIIIECGYNISAAITGNIIQFSAIPGLGDTPGDHCLKLHNNIDCRHTITHVNGVQPSTFGTIDLQFGDKIEANFIGDTIELKSNISGINPYCKESADG